MQPLHANSHIPFSLDSPDACYSILTLAYNAERTIAATCPSILRKVDSKLKSNFGHPRDRYLSPLLFVKLSAITNEIRSRILHKEHTLKNIGKMADFHIISIRYCK